MEVETLGDQGRANEEEEGEGEHLHGGVAADEVVHRSREDHHEPDRDHHRDDHDRDLVDHADGGDDRVEREDDVEDGDLDEDRTKGGPPLGGVGGRLGMSFDLVVQLLRAFPKEEKAPKNENDVFAREIVGVDLEEGFLQLHHPGDAEKQDDAGHHREGEPEEARPRALFRRKLVDEDRDEDDVVDPEDDLHHRQGEKGDPGLRAGEPRKIEVAAGEERFKEGHDKR